jgi:hypothetical protein
LRAFQKSSFVASLLFAAACSDGTSDDPASCGIGEARTDDDTCASVDGLQVNLDERLDVRDATARRGIGAFACTLRPFAHVPVDEEGACVLYRFDGELIAEGFVGDAGGIVVELDESITLLPSSSSCYDSDLFPTRSDLFTAHQPFFVRGSGGDDFPAFDAVVVAPETLAVDAVDSVSRTTDLVVRWLPSTADAIVFVINTHVEAVDESARIVCVYDDGEGEGRVDARLLGGLLNDDDEAALSFLRQRVTHIEPTEATVSIDLFATSSVIMSAPLIP